MTIAYLEPLRRAYRRMVEILFQPFDIGTWFVIGFGCWLARLVSGGYGGGGTWKSEDLQDFRVSGLPEAASEAFHELSSRIPYLVAIVGCVLVALIVLFVVLLWLSSRGEFLFLDNVLRRRPAVREPWKEYRREGNSLFLWRLGFILAGLFLALLTALPGLAFLLSGDEENYSRIFGGVVLLLVPLMLLGIALAYVQLFLTHFVAPLMYRYRLSTTRAWGRFLPIFKAEPLHFLLYGLFVLLLHILLVVGLLIAILATCCVAGLVLAIPFVGTVILLPVHTTFRAFSLEFLVQFGPEADPFVGVPPATPEAPPAPPPSSEAAPSSEVPPSSGGVPPEGPAEPPPAAP